MCSFVYVMEQANALSISLATSRCEQWTGQAWPPARTRRQHMHEAPAPPSHLVLWRCLLSMMTALASRSDSRQQEHHQMAAHMHQCSNTGSPPAGASKFYHGMSWPKDRLSLAHQTPMAAHLSMRGCESWNPSSATNHRDSFHQDFDPRGRCRNVARVLSIHRQ